MPDFLPDRLEAGTHNIPGVAGLLEGLRYVKERGTGSILAHERAMTCLAARGLSEIPGVMVYTAADRVRQAGVLSFQLDGMDCEAVGTPWAPAAWRSAPGLHCAPLAHQSAGTFETGTIRASFSSFSTRREVDQFVREVAALRRGRGKRGPGDPA